MGIKVKHPMTININNTGAMFVGMNRMVGQRTKHIDIRANFVREFIQDDVLKLVFVRTIENNADLLTKNMSGDVYDKLVISLITDKMELGYGPVNTGRSTF